MLRGSDSEAHVSNTAFARVSFRRGDGLRVGINPVNPCRERRDAERQAAVAAPEVQDALPAHERRAAPLCELVFGTRPESRSYRGDMLSDVAFRVRYDTAHGAFSIKVVGRNPLPPKGHELSIF
jgi:hypothetical protein